MLTFIIGLLLAVWIAFHQISEHYRFDLVSDAKNGGVFVIDKKNAALNYCDNKSCTLVGSGALPSQMINNPSALASLQNAIMGAPAPITTLQPGQAPDGMGKNLATSGAEKADHPDEEKPQDAEEDSNNDDNKDESSEEDKSTDTEDEDKQTSEDDDKKVPEGFDF